MQQFWAGLVIGLIAAVIAAAFLLRKKVKSPPDSDKSKEFEQLGRLTGELAHEIKNPLSTIRVNLKLTAEELKQIELSKGSDQSCSRALRKIGVIEKEADRLEQILNGFLKYIDRSRPQLENLDVNSLVIDMIDFYSPQAQSHSITVRTALADGELVCKADKNMLKQAMLNLFINAQQAMEAGGELMIKTDKQDDNAVIRISDTGTGISPEKLERIFEPYYSSKSGGSGLGLATVRKIIESHNGKISVDSEVGKGTLFTMKLPLV